MIPSRATFSSFRLNRNCTEAETGRWQPAREVGLVGDVGWVSEAKDHDVYVYNAFLTATAPVVRAVSFGGRARFVAFESGGIG
jgi:hypothetical protein